MASSSKIPSKRTLKPGPRVASVKYPPYEMTERDTSLTAADHAFLQVEWKRYNVQQYSNPSNLIGDITYSVPYNGNSKNSGGKKASLEDVTGKKQFDCKQYRVDTAHTVLIFVAVHSYSFVMPGDKQSPPTVWDIMWDYETGMVRTMSIWRALGYEKVSCST